MKRIMSLCLVLVLIITGSFMGCTKEKSDDTANYEGITDETRGSSVYGNSSSVNDNVQFAPEAPNRSEAISESTTDTSGNASNKDVASDSSLAAPQDTLSLPQYRYDTFYTPGNTEEYTQITEIGFKNTYSNPLSTFSIDVDTASYTNLRKNLNYGIIPEADAIRIEEMLNYFNYDYKEPVGNIPFTINTEIGKCPWNEDNYLLMVGIQGKNVDKEELAKSNLVFLIDVSGSMDEPDKLPLLKSAFSNLVEVLGENDRVSIVVYAGDSGVVLDSVRGSNKEKILDAIEGLSAGGSTSGAEGIDLAYRMAEKNFIKEGNNRVILATDGDFNVGPSSVTDLEEIIEEKRQSGIFLSVMGFGTGNLKDNRMETLADKGNGNYSYIDSVKEAKRVLVDEMAGTLLTIAKDVKIQLEFNPYRVSGYRLIGYENRALANEDFENDAVDAGELGAGHTVTAIYEVIPAGTSSVPEKDMRYQSNETDINIEYKDEISEIRLRYKEPDKEDSREIKHVVSLQNTPANGKELSEDFYFAAAVAEFGMLLRNSEYKGDTSIDTIQNLAEKGLGGDKDGYRLEFMNLVDYYEELTTYPW